jgi:hypothetical protein
MRWASWIGVGCVALALAGCGQAQNSADRNLDSLDNELTDANSAGKDPALMAALHDQIMVDPALTGQSNKDAVRPAPQPYSAPVPPDAVASAGSGAAAPAATSEVVKHAPEPAADCPQCQVKQQAVTLAGVARRSAAPRTAACVRQLKYSAGWATRLPDDLPLYPDARVDEAAGADTGGCALRIVSFASATPMDRLIDWYYTKAASAGYSADHQSDGRNHVVGGTRGNDAYVVYFSPHAGGGTDVQIVANNGR